MDLVLAYSCNGSHRFFTHLAALAGQIVDGGDVLLVERGLPSDEVVEQWGGPVPRRCPRRRRPFARVRIPRSGGRRRMRGMRGKVDKVRPPIARDGGDLLQ